MSDFLYLAGVGHFRQYDGRPVHLQPASAITAARSSSSNAAGERIHPHPKLLPRRGIQASIGGARGLGRPCSRQLRDIDRILQVEDQRVSGGIGRVLSPAYARCRPGRKRNDLARTHACGPLSQHERRAAAGGDLLVPLVVSALVERSPMPASGRDWLLSLGNDRCDGTQGVSNEDRAWKLHFVPARGCPKSYHRSCRSTMVRQQPRE